MPLTNPEAERRLNNLEITIFGSEEWEGLRVKVSNLEQFQKRIERRDWIVIGAAITQTFIILGGLLTILVEKFLK